jgi:hypothetical protein
LRSNQTDQLSRHFSLLYLIVVDFVLDSSDGVSVPGVAEVLHQHVAGQVKLGQRDEAITDAGLFMNPFFGRNSQSIWSNLNFGFLPYMALKT